MSKTTSYLDGLLNNEFVYNISNFISKSTSGWEVDYGSQ